ncbi:hypothetical protein CPC16_003794 [Podila verticillata]|nr:hypothetical protein CPC16_003794 [Podila verticillata]
MRTPPTAPDDLQRIDAWINQITDQKIAALETELYEVVRTILASDEAAQYVDIFSGLTAPDPPIAPNFKATFDVVPVIMNLLKPLVLNLRADIRNTPDLALPRRAREHDQRSRERRRRRQTGARRRPSRNRAPERDDLFHGPVRPSPGVDGPRLCQRSRQLGAQGRGGSVLGADGTAEGVPDGAAEGRDWAAQVSESCQRA